MSEEKFTPREQTIIERLRNAPQKQLSPRISEDIHRKMLAEFANPTPALTASSGAAGAAPPTVLVMLLMGLASVVVIIGILITSPQQQENTPVPLTLSTDAPTAAPTITIAPATETHTSDPTLTLTATASATATPGASATPSSSATAVPSDAPSATATANLTPTPEVVRISIEGVIQFIDAESITVHDIRIELSPEQLIGLRVGDTIRVEGETDLTAQIVIIHALSVVRVQVTAPANPGSGPSSPGSSGGEQFDCNNPPPPWAPAHGWRARCEGSDAPGNSGRGRGASGSGAEVKPPPNAGQKNRPRMCEGGRCAIQAGSSVNRAKSAESAGTH